MIRSPVSWVGGKSSLLDWILSEFPEHKCFVDVFGGSGAVLLNKIPCNNDVYNDLNGNLATLFKVLCNKDDTEELVRRLDNTLYSRDEFNHAKDNIDTEPDPIERARLMFVLHNQSFAGFGGTWGYSIAADTYKINPPYRFQQKIKDLQVVHNRIKYVTVENLSFSEIIPKYSSPDTLFYLDPPYCPTSRTGGSCYKHEMDFDEHVKMVDNMLGSDAMFILSGFDTEAYRPLEKAGYTRKVKTRAVMIDPKLSQYRTEILWISSNIRRASLLPLFMENSLTSI